ncbi:hypothetical protein V6N13_148457 [Hibiscus sabdariffa]|uniref:Uncharacterized protein n=1 Tax=Hibiscus sabdariffa TaxID=183260 RepID=A0ABR2TYY2_9ROSI
MKVVEQGELEWFYTGHSLTTAENWTVVAGFELPAQGEVKDDGRELHEWRKGVVVLRKPRCSTPITHECQKARA